MENVNVENVVAPINQAPSAQIKKNDLGFYIISSIIILILLAAVVAVFLIPNKIAGLVGLKGANKVKTTSNTTEQTAETKTSMKGVAPTATTSLQQLTNEEGGYQFQYLASWKVNKQASMTTINNPIDDTNSTNIFGAGIIINAIPYQSAETAPGVTVTVNGKVPTIPSKDQQITDMAIKMTNTGTTGPVMVGQLKGVEAVSSGSDSGDMEINIRMDSSGATSSSKSGPGKIVYTDNILLQGKNKMFLLQFVGVKELNQLSPDQKIILNSFREL